MTTIQIKRFTSLLFFFLFSLSLSLFNNANSRQEMVSEWWDFFFFLKGYLRENTWPGEGGGLREWLAGWLKTGNGCLNYYMCYTRSNKVSNLGNLVRHYVDFCHSSGTVTASTILLMSPGNMGEARPAHRSCLTIKNYPSGSNRPN